MSRAATRAWESLDADQREAVRDMLLVWAQTEGARAMASPGASRSSHIEAIAAALARLEDPTP